MENQSIAQIGLTYSKDVFDTERYESAERLAEKSDISIKGLKIYSAMKRGIRRLK